MSLFFISFKKMDWEINIKKVDNGYVVTHKADGEDWTIQRVFEENENEKDAMTDLLYYVSEHFGFFHDKYSSKNLNIKWDMEGSKVGDE